MLIFYAAVLGAVFGSFLNVVIHRYPLEESLLHPPSHCPNCNQRIKPWDNVPILSYLLLLGRCRHCKIPISPRYPLVELSNAVLWAAVYAWVGPTIGFVLLAITMSMLIALIYIDLDHQYLPDVIDKPGMVIGLIVGWQRLGEHHSGLMLSSSLLDSVIGAVAGYLVLWIVARAYMALRHIEGMGEGDMKMLAMIGATLGWQALPIVLFLASLTGAVFGVALAIRRKSNLQFALPFGVFLGLATIGTLFFGHTLIAWYRGAIVP